MSGTCCAPGAIDDRKWLRQASGRARVAKHHRVDTGALDRITAENDDDEDGEYGHEERHSVADAVPSHQDLKNDEEQEQKQDEYQGKRREERERVRAYRKPVRRTRRSGAA